MLRGCGGVGGAVCSYPLMHAACAARGDLAAHRLHFLPRCKRGQECACRQQQQNLEHTGGQPSATSNATVLHHEEACAGRPQPGSAARQTLKLPQACLYSSSRSARQVCLCLRHITSSNARRSHRQPDRRASARFKELPYSLQAHPGGEARHCSDAWAQTANNRMLKREGTVSCCVSAVLSCERCVVVCVGKAFLSPGLTLCCTVPDKPQAYCRSRSRF